ncbi:MAG: hypothetical protein EA381_15240, partial [Planctomycetaceae bacterium]
DHLDDGRMKRVNRYQRSESFRSDDRRRTKYPIAETIEIDPRCVVSLFRDGNRRSNGGIVPEIPMLRAIDTALRRLRGLRSPSRLVVRQTALADQPAW